MISRRKFIQKAGLAASTLPLMPAAETLFNNQNQNQAVLRVAIMGLGSYANRVARAMESCTRAKVVGVISGTP